jgi:hypothetical protein
MRTTTRATGETMTMIATIMIVTMTTNRYALMRVEHAAFARDFRQTATKWSSCTVSVARLLSNESANFS